MPVISLNLDDIPDAPEPVKDGTYQGVVTGVVLKDSKNSDTQNINWEITIADGAEEGKRVFHNSNLSIKSMPFTKRTLASFGITGDVELGFDEDGDPAGDGCMLLNPDLVGEPVTVVVTTQRDKNDPTKKYTSISSLIGPKGEVPTTKSNGAPKSSTGLGQGERKRFR
jgi:Protein of unknown function (DUF669)